MAYLISPRFTKELEVIVLGYIHSPDDLVFLAVAAGLLSWIPLINKTFITDVNRATHLVARCQSSLSRPQIVRLFEFLCTKHAALAKRAKMAQYQTFLPISFCEINPSTHAPVSMVFRCRFNLLETCLCKYVSEYRFGQAIEMIMRFPVKRLVVSPMFVQVAIVLFSRIRFANEIPYRMKRLALKLFNKQTLGTIDFGKAMNAVFSRNSPAFAQWLCEQCCEKQRWATKHQLDYVVPPITPKQLALYRNNRCVLSIGSFPSHEHQKWSIPTLVTLDKMAYPKKPPTASEATY